MIAGVMGTAQAIVAVTDILKTRFPNLTTSETTQIAAQVVTATVEAFKWEAK